MNAVGSTAVAAVSWFSDGEAASGVDADDTDEDNTDAAADVDDGGERIESALRMAMMVALVGVMAGCCSELDDVTKLNLATCSDPTPRTELLDKGEVVVVASEAAGSKN